MLPPESDELDFIPRFKAEEPSNISMSALSNPDELDFVEI